MLPVGRSFLILLLFSTFVLSQRNKSKKSKNIFGLLGYLQGYKVGYNFAQRWPPTVPIIILPIVNQHQNVSIIKTMHDNKNEDGEHLTHTDSPEKLVSDNSTDIINIYNDTDATSKEEIKRFAPIPNGNQSAADEFRQANIPINFTSDLNAEMINATVVMIKDNSTDVEYDDPDSGESISNATKNPVTGLYATANYNNEAIDNLTFTINPDSTALPPAGDNRWEMFKNITDSTWNVPATEHANKYQLIATTERYGPYASALYQINDINQISLTTEYYTKDDQLPPVLEDNWQFFSPHKISIDSGSFKPLAGLYYDGYLNTPVKKQEFLPKNWYKYYF